jgi:hypothetical protein
LIEKVDANTFIYYARGKPPTFFVDPRDFCLLSRIYHLGEGHIMTISIIFHKIQLNLSSIQRYHLLKEFKEEKLYFQHGLLKNSQTGKQISL